MYYALIRSKLEYGSIIWHPIYQVHINNLEAVQRKFLKFLWFTVDGIYPERGYDHAALLQRFEFMLLQLRRIIAMKFLTYSVNNRIDCEMLLNKVNYLVPRIHSRQDQSYYVIRL